jgi:hypothetical protein
MGDAVQGSAWIDDGSATALLWALAAVDAAPLDEWVAAHALGPAEIAWLNAQALSPFVYARLRETGALARLTAEGQEALRRAYYSAAIQAMVRESELIEVLDALGQEQVIPILFKGAALAYTVYPSPACRLMGDLDLWLTAEEMPRARAALERVGFAQRTRTRRPLALQAQYAGEVQMVRAQPPGSLVELHWGIFAGEWLKRTTATDVASVRGRAQAGPRFEREGRPLPTLLLAPEDAMIQLAVHATVNHQLAAPWTRSLLDAALLVRRQGIDWAVVADRARAWRVATPLWAFLTLARELVGLEEADPALAALAPSLARRRVLSWLAAPRALLTMRNLTRGRARFVLLLSLIDRPSDMLRLFGRALWPETEWLAARYGEARPATRLRHLLAAFRGRL